jgi:hypothetical protein
MDKQQDHAKFMAAMDFCSRHPLRQAIWYAIHSGFRGNFQQLVWKVNSRAKNAAPHVAALFDAGHIDFIPEGTPMNVIDGTSAADLVIEGTCLRLEGPANV